MPTSLDASSVLNSQPRGVAAGLVLLALVGLLLPLGDIYRYPDRLSVLPSLQVDAVTYDGLAATIAGGGSLADIPIRQPPGFIALLAALYSVAGHSLVAAKLMLWACLVTAVLLSAWLSMRIWGPRAGTTAAALVATSPAMRHYVGTIQYEVVAAALFLAVIAAIHASARARARLSLTTGLAGAGLLAGVLVLTREVFVGVVPLLACWIWWLGRTRLRTAAGILAMIFLGFSAVPVVAWSVFQTYRSGQTVFISDKGSLNFALGSNPRASGTYNADQIEEPSGLAFVRAEPRRALILTGRKIAYFWGILRDGWNVPRPMPLWVHRGTFGTVPVEWLSPLARGGWLLLAVFGATALIWRRGLASEWWVLPASVVAVCGAHALTLSSHRFAVPVVPVVLVLAAGPLSAALASAYRWVLSSRPRRQFVAACGVLAFYGQYGPWPREFAYRAAELEALNASNAPDADTNDSIRVVAASLGPRAAFVLGDEYLPGGYFQLLITMRRGQNALGLNEAVARARVTDLDGSSACSEDIPAGIVPQAGFGKVWIPCELRKDGPATLVVDALGVTDLAFDEIAIVRRHPTRRLMEIRPQRVP